MSHAFFLVSTGAGAGLTTVSLGLVRALDRIGIRAGFYKPFAQLHDGDQGPERSTHLIEQLSGIKTMPPISLRRAESLLGAGQLELLMEEVVALYQQSIAHTDVVVIEGLVADGHAGYATRLNVAIAKALDAEVILVGKPEPDLEEYINIAANAFTADGDTTLIATILNKVGMPSDTQPALLEADTLQAELVRETPLQDPSKHPMCAKLRNKAFHFMGCVPWQKPLTAVRMADIAHYLDAKVINAGCLQDRRVHRMELCARTLANTLSVHQPHTLLIFPGDRDDVFVAACMSALNGVQLAGILLTGGLRPDARVMTLCEQALQTGIPLLLVHETSFQTAAKLVNMPAEVAIDDIYLINQAMDHVADHLDANWLRIRCANKRKTRLSPAAFRYQLIEQARQKKRRIVLPEGIEPRTIIAAYQCQKRGIADCILLGDPSTIQRVAAAQGITINDDCIVNPPNIIANYIEGMVNLRKHKGMTHSIAKDQLQSRMILGTMMLAMGDVDGLVSGAEHTTANTVRPAFQLIGTSESAKLVSSVFFMCLPDQVVVYGDCAINPDPDAAELADIAIQSADSATQFGLDPHVAMISYSTGESGTGQDVEKVRQATQMVRQRRPDLLVDGPLQYDAAAISSVGKSKAPKSLVAGKANVFVFPDLNTGNTTYKAVQRSANVVSVGPMLQGLNKPVNDLSRGATVEDIVYTIALTAIQAG
ncbi:MAG: phosphate acetyltransferase [Mariprofundaceae bacterium]|nr:phosphate acetyltransferase [Mariprofundaceae bacterium]